MSRFLANLGLLIYVLMSAAALLWWMPNFFIVNLDHLPQLTYRYWTASGLPFGLLMMTLAGRQSVLPHFRLGLTIEVALAGLFLWLGLYTFYFPAQANFFCAVHLGICAAFSLLNYYGYRREMTQLERRAVAA